MDAKTRLRKHLDRSGLTVKQFARAHDLSAGLVSQWLCGHRMPGRAYALKLQKIAGIPVASWDRAPEKAA